MAWSRALGSRPRFFWVFQVEAIRTYRLTVFLLLGTLALSLRICVVLSVTPRKDYPKVVDLHLSTSLAQTIRRVHSIIFLRLYEKYKIYYGA